MMSIEHLLQYLKASCIKAPDRYLRTMLLLVISSCFLFTTVSVVYATVSYEVKLVTPDCGDCGIEGTNCTSIDLTGTSGNTTLPAYDYDQGQGEIGTHTFTGMPDVGHIEKIQINHSCHRDNWRVRYVEITKSGRAYLFSDGNGADSYLGWLDSGGNDEGNVANGPTDLSSGKWYDHKIVEQHPPEAHNVNMTGTLSVGQTLTGSYDFYDADGDQAENSISQWYHATDSACSSKIAITGANSTTYNLTKTSAGYYICFGVTPHAHSGLPDGDEVIITQGPLAKLSQSITFGALTDKNYGDSSFTVGATTDSGLSVSYSTSGNCSNSGSSLSITGAGSCTVTASQSGNANYEAASSKYQTFSIAKKQAYITFNPPTKTFGDSPFNLSATGDANKSVSYTGGNSVCSVTQSGNVTIHNAGSCSITANQDADDNHIKAAPVTKAILIRRQPQTINFSSVSTQKYLDDPFSLSATGGSSGNPVVLESKTPDVCSGSGENAIEITINTAGTCTIEATQAGASNYEAAIPTPKNIIIQKLPQAITDYIVPSEPKTYGDASFTVSAVTANANNSGNPVTFSSSTPTICTVSGEHGEEVSIIGAGTCTVVADQASDVNYSPAPSVSQSVSIAKLDVIAIADEKTRGYGEAVNPAFTFSYAGLVNGDDSSVIDTPPNGSTVADINSLVDTYEITCSGGSDNNYTITDCTTGTLNVIRAETNSVMLSDDPDPSPPPQNITFEFKVTPVSGNEPTGIVTVTDGQNSCSAELQTGDSGRGSCLMMLGGVGFKDITATYAGDDRFNASTSAPIEHEIDNVGVVITELDDKTTVHEDGSITDTYTLELTTVPLSSVMVTVTPEIQVALNGQSVGVPVTLTFTDVTPQTVTVTANDDTILEGTHTSTIMHTATSDDSDYDEIAIASTTVHIYDNDPGIVIKQTGKSTDVIEGGLTDVYSVMLGTQPTDTVTVAISADTESTVSPTTLTFNADTTALESQIVTVKAVDDRAADGLKISVIGHTSTSSDSDYDIESVSFVVDGEQTAEIKAKVGDNDVPGVSIIGSNLSVSESGAKDRYSVVLNTRPQGTSEVTIKLSKSSSSCLVEPSTLTFSTSNWDITQVVTVMAVDDDVYESSDGCTIRHSSSGGDYDNLSIGEIQVQVRDNDPKPLTYLTIKFTENGQGTIFANNQSCHSDDETCRLEFFHDQKIELLAYPDSGFAFNKWTGHLLCKKETFSLYIDISCTADFKLGKRYLIVESLRGTVYSSPSGINNCAFLQGRCAASFEGGSEIKLTSKAEEGWISVGWEGACDEEGRLKALTRNMTCTALYEPEPARFDSLEVFDYESEIILEGSGLDFDTQVGHPITRKVGLRNTHQISRMLLTDLLLPKGFSPVSAFPSRLEPNQTVIFQIQLDAQVEDIYEGLWSFKVGEDMAAYPLIGVVHETCPTASDITILYVKQGATIGDGGGCNWDYPFKDLQTALIAIANNKYPKVKEVWVTSGTYKPTTDTDRTKSFVLTEGVSIYGGFLGTEEQRKDRNEHLYECPAPTILSGDIGVEEEANDNSYHVVSAYGVSSDTGLYDVTITGGNANGGNTRRTREGRTRSDSDQDHFSKGGGMYNDNASLTIDDVLFAGNAAISGGGMFNGNGSSPIVSNAAFANNAAVNGGGMLNDNSSPAIVNVAFTQNQASDAGGGMVNQNNATPLLNNVVMNSNAAKIGGGLVNDNSSPSITMSYFTHNSAREGGAMVNRNHSKPMIDNSFLSDNTATASGGGMLNINSQPILMRSVISGNVAPVGSGIANQAGSKMLMSRSVVEENQDAAGTITAQIVDDSSSQTTVNNSNVQGGWAGTGTNNSDKLLNIDNILTLKLPLDDIKASTNNSADFNFAGVAYAPEPNEADTAGATDVNTASKGNQVESVGPVLAGDTQVGSALTEGEEAILTQLKEEAACPETTVLYVNSNVEASGTGCSWESPLTHLQVALAATATPAFSEVQEIWLAKGLYKPTTGVDRQAAFQLRKGIAIYGSFAGMETQREARTPNINTTMLSGDIGIQGDNSDNSYHVVTGIGTDATAVLSDVVISGGNANEGMNCPDACGGGLYIDQGSPTLKNLLVKENSAIYGGGLFNGNASQPLIEDSVFQNNAAMDGAGILNDFSEPTISRVFLKDNTATHQGGGMMNRNQAHARLSHVNLSSNKAAWGGGLSNDKSNPVITHSLMSDNQADYGGGLVNLNQSAPVMNQVILTGNGASHLGGALINNNSQLLINQSTISENTAPTGSGVVNEKSQTVINNSILWDNQYPLAANDITPQILDDLGTPSTPVTTVNYSIIQGGWQGLGQQNQDNNPLFVKPVVNHIATHTAEGDFHLRPDSPAIDAGNNALSDCHDIDCSARLDKGEHDFEGKTRRVDGNGDGFAQVDLGAYEFQGLQATQKESEQSEFSTTMAPLATLSEICFTSEREHFSGVCHAKGQVIPYAEIKADSSLSDAIVDKPLSNQGLVSNVSVTEQGMITGGQLSGYIKNNGIISDFEFVGAAIQGSHQTDEIVGTLGGKITNRSQIGGFIQDVNLAPNTIITGGLVKRQIRGDAKGPATLASLTIDSESQVSHVILHKDVLIQENVTLTEVVLQGLEVNEAILAGRIQNSNAGRFKNVQLAAHAHLTGGQLLGRIVGQANAPALLDFVSIQPRTYLNHVILGKQVNLAKGVRFGENVWFESTITKGIGVDKYGKPVLNKTGTFGIATKERLSEPFTVFADEALDILTTIRVDAEHQGEFAELLMVQRFNAQDFEMRIGENWTDWDGQINHLQAMTVVAQSPKNAKIPITINPPLGECWLYFGYRLENGTIIHNGQKPLHLKVVERTRD